MEKLNYKELKDVITKNRANVGWSHVLHAVKELESSEIGFWERLEQVNRLNKLLKRKGYALQEDCFYPLMGIEKKVEKGKE